MDVPKPAESPKPKAASKVVDAGGKPAESPKSVAMPKGDPAKPADPPKK